MVQFKIVKVPHDNCAELNAAAADGFHFVEWFPPDGKPDAYALVAKDEEHDAQRADLRAVGDTLIEFARQYLENLQNAPTEAPPASEAASPEPEAAPTP